MRTTEYTPDSKAANIRRRPSDFVFIKVSSEEVKELGSELRSHLSWWAENTRVEKHMCTETVASLQEKLYAGVIVTHHGSPIAAAGIFPARTHDDALLYFNGSLVVELGSNYVNPAFRSNGIGSRLINERITIARENRWLPISVTSNPVVQNLFVRRQAVPMDTEPMYKEIQGKLCICKVLTEKCLLCPLLKNGGWVL